MAFSIQLLLLFFVVVWLLIISVIVARFYSYYSRLIRHDKRDSLFAMIDEMIGKQKHIEQSLSDIHKKYDLLAEGSLLHIQKIGMLRFNPFKDTGGDQSFILALLDAHDTGIVISSLHTRSGTRWYAKKVHNGNSGEYELSDDEKRVLKDATFLNKL